MILFLILVLVSTCKNIYAVKSYISKKKVFVLYGNTYVVIYIYCDTFFKIFLPNTNFLEIEYFSLPFPYSKTSHVPLPTVFQTHAPLLLGIIACIYVSYIHI